MFEKIILITRKTRLTELIERMNTKGQARFYLEQAGIDFSIYEKEDQIYQHSLNVVRKNLDVGLKVQVVDRALVPTLLFQETDLIITLGQDGLVANTAKYVGSQPIIGVNPDAERFDGVLLPFLPEQVKETITCVLQGKARTKKITLAEAKLNDGQRLLAFNDLFIGSKSHVSARYQIQFQKQTEPHSSSGVLVSTGAGSTGWLSSMFNMVQGLSPLVQVSIKNAVKLDWEDHRLVFVVREPFISKHSQAQLVSGMIQSGESLVLTSTMPQGGVIFSDGMEQDFLAFNSGSIVSISASLQKAQLVIK